MISSKLCFAATAIIRDGESNFISAFNVIEGMVAAGFPMFVPQLSSFALWLRDEGDPQRLAGTFTVSLNDDVLTRVAMHVDFGNVFRSRSVINMNGLVVPRAGVLWFRFALDNGVHAEYDVAVQPPPAVAVQGG
jgi:hypothetical protein